MRSWALLLLVLAACAGEAPDADGTDGWSGWDDSDPSADTDPADTDDTEPDGASAATVRVATWNVQSLGAVGTEEHAATQRVLARLDADVVCLNEVEPEDEDDLDTLAEALGYGRVVWPDTNPFGDLRNAALVRGTPDAVWVPTAGELSDDAGARDVTRAPVTVRWTVDGTTLGVVCQHWKSGFDTVDVFRRAVDSQRTAQAAVALSTVDVLVVAGDMNAEPDEVPVPATLSGLPSGLPSSYALGDDLVAVLGEGLTMDPFAPLEAASLERIAAVQRDGDAATRPTSGRIIDHVWIRPSPEIGEVLSEVYDTRDEYLSGLADGGDKPNNPDGSVSSDHLPVLVEIHLNGS